MSGYRDVVRTEDGFFADKVDESDARGVGAGRMAFHGLLQRFRAGAGFQQCRDFFDGTSELVGDLFDGRLPLQLRREHQTDLADAPELVEDMDRQADRALGLGDGTAYRLPYPPDRVGREFTALGPIELFDGLHQADIPVLDHIQELASRDAALRYMTDQAQIAFDEFQPRLRASSSATRPVSERNMPRRA